jgi:hypothetical protein
MAEIINLDTLNPEPRTILITVPAGGRKLPAFLVKWLRIPVIKNIKIIVNPPSFRLSQTLAQKYLQFVKLSLESVENLLESGGKSGEMQDLMIDIVVTAIKPGFPLMSKQWIEEMELSDEVLVKLFEFVVQPIQDKIRKNAATLQGLIQK